MRLTLGKAAPGFFASFGMQTRNARQGKGKRMPVPVVMHTRVLLRDHTVL